MAKWTASNQADLPIDLLLLRRAARVHGAEEDEQLGFLARAAAEQIERDCRLAIAARELTATVPVRRPTFVVPLPRGPFIDVTSITYVDDQDQEQAIGVEAADHDGEVPGHLTITPGVDASEITVTYRAGHLELPPSMQLLIQQLAAYWFEHPEAATADGGVREVPLAYRHIIRSLDPMTDGVR